MGRVCSGTPSPRKNTGMEEKSVFLHTGNSSPGTARPPADARSCFWCADRKVLPRPRPTGSIPSPAAEPRMRTGAFPNTRRPAFMTTHRSSAPLHRRRLGGLSNTAMMRATSVENSCAPPARRQGSGCAPSERKTPRREDSQKSVPRRRGGGDAVRNGGYFCSAFNSFRYLSVAYLPSATFAASASVMRPTVVKKEAMSA